jgi:hypothetical protein
VDVATDHIPEAGPPPGGDLSGEQRQPPSTYAQQRQVNRADSEQESNTR